MNVLWSLLDESLDVRNELRRNGAVGRSTATTAASAPNKNMKHLKSPLLRTPPSSPKSTNTRKKMSSMPSTTKSAATTTVTTGNKKSAAIVTKTKNKATRSTVDNNIGGKKKNSSSSSSSSSKNNDSTANNDIGKMTKDVGDHIMGWFNTLSEPPKFPDNNKKESLSNDFVEHRDDNDIHEKDAENQQQQQQKDNRTIQYEFHLPSHVPTPEDFRDDATLIDDDYDKEVPTSTQQQIGKTQRGSNETKTKQKQKQRPLNQQNSHYGILQNILTVVDDLTTIAPSPPTDLKNLKSPLLRDPPEKKASTTSNSSREQSAHFSSSSSPTSNNRKRLGSSDSVDSLPLPIKWGPEVWNSPKMMKQQQNSLFTEDTLNNSSTSTGTTATSTTINTTDDAMNNSSSSHEGTIKEEGSGGSKNINHAVNMVDGFELDITTPEEFAMQQSLLEKPATKISAVVVNNDDDDADANISRNSSNHSNNNSNNSKNPLQVHWMYRNSINLHQGDRGSESFRFYDDDDIDEMMVLQMKQHHRDMDDDEDDNVLKNSYQKDLFASTSSLIANLLPMDDGDDELDGDPVVTSAAAVAA